MKSTGLDFLGKYEKIDSVVRYILGRVFHRFDMEKLGREHATNANSQLSDMLDGNMISRIYKLYYDDFERFDYPKQKLF